MTSRLKTIKNFGQQIWLDNLSRELLISGKLQQLIEEDGISGVTSNPTIFQKAISSDIHYQADLATLKTKNLSYEERYESLVIPDIQAACDILLPLYHQTSCDQGYVSLELSPELANDAEGSVTNAIRLWQKINRPNLMIKVPATAAGVKTLEQLISRGINVNITLLFSLSQVLDTWNAYINGLVLRHNQGQTVANIRAVASFFISRIDAAVDDKLPNNLQGKAAICLAKKAYQLYSQVFSNSKFTDIDGAKAQQLLWASTGTKNPNYSDVVYVEELIGANTVNTVPDATLNAFRDHGIAASRLNNDPGTSIATLEEIGKYVNLEEVGNKLQRDGLSSFSASFNELINLMQ